MLPWYNSLSVVLLVLLLVTSVWVLILLELVSFSTVAHLVLLSQYLAAFSLSLLLAIWTLRKTKL
jgi:hypothetical protein